MEKLNFRDAAFLRAETSERPLHIGALLVFSRPKDAASTWMRRLADAFSAVARWRSPYVAC